MKRTILTTVLLTVSYFLYSQTTLEEYNYLTKGYKIQLENGLDMKKGYRFDDSPITDYLGYKIQTKALIRDGENKAAALLIVFQRPDGYTFYVCLPHILSEQSIWQQHYYWLEDIGSDDRMVYLKYITTMYSAILSDYEIKDEPTTK